MNAALENLAAQFTQAWTSRRQIDAVGLQAPASAQDAYAVQDLVFGARFPGKRMQAWKAGASSPEGEPSAAPIGAVYPSPAVLPASAFNMFCIEAEVALRMGRDLPPEAQTWSEADLAGSVDEVLVTIELCDTRLAEWKAASALWRLADFQLNGALVIGSGTQEWRNIDFAAQPAELWVNGQKKVAKVGSHPMGHPMKVLPWTGPPLREALGRP